MTDPEVMAAGVNYEVWVGGKPTKWGNMIATYTPSDIMNLMDVIRDRASEACGCDPKDVRIISMWRLA